MIIFDRKQHPFAGINLLTVTKIVLDDKGILFYFAKDNVARWSFDNVELRNDKIDEIESMIHNYYSKN